MSEEGDEGPFLDHEHKAELARDLSVFDITMIGVGAMIGAGIFVLTGHAAGEAGPALVMVFAFNGLVAIFTAMVYAELGSAIPEAGGGYLWVREALGRSQAFLAGWMSWFAHAVAGSLYTLGFGSFATLLMVEYFRFHPLGISEPILMKVFAVFAGVLFTYINYRGAKETGMAGSIVTLIKVTVILVFVLAGLGVIFGDPVQTVDSFKPFLPAGFSGVFIAMGLTFIAFEGYEIIVQSGEEVKNPRKSVPKAVFYSMGIVVTLYILVAIVLIGAVDVTPELVSAAESTGISLPQNSSVWQVLGNLGELGLARAANQILPYGTLIILVAGIFSTLSALNATTFSSTRVGFAMGRDLVLPGAFSSVHPQKRTPYVSTLFSGGLIIFMAVTLPIEAVAAAADVMFLLLFLQVNYAAIIIRREWGDQIDYGYLIPIFPYGPIIGIAALLGLAVYLYNYSPLAWYGAGVWLLAGLIIFFLYSRPRLKDAEIKKETRMVVEERAPEEKPYRILVPLANPMTAGALVRTASTIARYNNGEILLTAVVTVPEQTPLSEGYRYIDEKRELLKDAMERVPVDVTAHWTVTIGHKVGQSIVNIAHQKESDLIVMGWRGRRKRFSDYVLGSNIDHVVEKAPCDVVVVKTNQVKEINNVLVPTAGGAQVELAKSIGEAYTDEGAHLTLVYVARKGNGEEVLERCRASFDEKDLPVETQVLRGDDVVDSILKYAHDNKTDAIIVGAAKEGVLKKVVFGEIPEKIGERFDGQVLMVRKRQPVKSFLRNVVNDLTERLKKLQTLKK